MYIYIYIHSKYTRLEEIARDYSERKNGVTIAHHEFLKNKAVNKTPINASKQI